MKKVVVRFAPSPTGYLHIGGARTALFNFLFARHNNGQFRLRIEDTDTQRSKQEYTDQIIDSMEWLGLAHDGEIVYQSRRMDVYAGYVERLLEEKKAYRCFCSREEIEERRAGDPGWKYDRKCCQLSEAVVEQNLSQGKPFVVRLFISDRDIRFQDMVRGDVNFKADEFEDFIIVRSDGSPIYQLTVVVDDHEMGVSHVIRGDDHLSNTPKQISIYNALGVDAPIFAHIPLILGPDKKRLSKRHGATSVEEYRAGGFLADALVNFIALLGWNPGDDRELMSLDEMIQAFSPDRISRSAAVFDTRKAEWLNGQYISQMSNEQLMRYFLSKFEEHGYHLTESKQLRKIVSLLKPRMRSLNDLYPAGLFFFQAPRQYDAKGIKKYFLQSDAYDIIQEDIDLIANCNPFDEERLEEQLREKAESHQQKAARYIHPLRLALTGTTASPGIFEVAVLLGREECLQRCKTALSFIKSELSE